MQQDEFSDYQLNQIRGIFNEGMEELVIPHLDKIYEKQEEHDKKFKQIDGRFNEIDGKFSEINGTLNDIEETLEDHTIRLDRIEKRQVAEQHLLDNHDIRIGKLERLKI